MRRILFGLLLCLLVILSAAEFAKGSFFWQARQPQHSLMLPPATAPAQATPTPIALQFQGGDLVRIDLPPDARPTDAAPTMTVAGLIVDVATGEKVKGAVYLGEKLVTSSVEQFTLVLPGELEEWLIVKAEGYHDWKVRVRYRVLHHKNLQVPVQLTPLTQPAPPASQI